MASVHIVRPTDLVALAAYEGHVRPNQAATRDRIGTQESPHPLETAIEQWFSFATGRHTWISVKGVTLRGLASARHRRGKTAWEMDCLLHTEEDQGVLMSLLDRVVEDAGRAGAEKVFLRVPAASDVVRAATASGFAAYLSERLLTADASQRKDFGGAPPPMRRWTRADAYATFRLYNRWTPEAVRRIEAPTFQEWTASRERLAPGRPRQWVLDRESEVAGWLRIAADGETGRFELMANAAAAPELLDCLIDAALSRLSQQSMLLTLVPEFAAGLRERLADRGFLEREGYVVLARRTSRPVEIAELAPAVPVPGVPA